MVKRSKARDTLLAVWCLCTGCWVRWCTDFGCGVWLLPNGDSKSDAHETHGSTCWIKETKWMGPNVSFALNHDDKSTRKAAVMLVIAILTENSWIYLFAYDNAFDRCWELHIRYTKRERSSCTKNRYDALSAFFFPSSPCPMMQHFSGAAPLPSCSMLLFLTTFFSTYAGPGGNTILEEWAG